MKSPKAVATCPQDQTSSAHSNTHSTTSKCSSLAKIPTQHQDTPWAYPFPHNPAYAHCHAASPTFSKNCPPTSASQPPQTATSPHGRDKAWHCSTESLASNPETLALTAKKDGKPSQKPPSEHSHNATHHSSQSCGAKTPKQPKHSSATPPSSPHHIPHHYQHPVVSSDPAPLAEPTPSSNN